MNYALNHEVVTGQKLPTKGKKKKNQTFFGTCFGFTNLFLPKTLGFCKILICHKNQNAVNSRFFAQSHIN